MAGYPASLHSCRSLIPVTVGHYSGPFRTPFRFLSDSIPILTQNCPVSARNTVRYESERCPTEIGTLSGRNRNHCPTSPGIRKRPLLVSSDAIESLFGLFKTIVQRNPQAELNRSIYLLPLLCGNRSYIEIDQSLKSCSHTQMLSQVEQTVPPTLRQQRTQQFKKCSTLVPKSGNFQRLETG